MTVIRTGDRHWLLTTACFLALTTLLAASAQAARLVVDIRFETYDQSIWGNGTTATITPYESGNSLIINNAALGISGPFDIAGVEADLQFAAGLDVGFSGDAGRADAALDYNVGLSFKYSEMVVGQWVPMQVVERLDESVLSTAFPQIKLRADLVLDVSASLGGSQIFKFDLSNPTFPPFNLTDNPQRLIGLNVNGDGKIEILPLVQEILLLGRAAGRLTPGVTLNLSVEPEEDKRKRTESGNLQPGQSSEKSDDKKKVKAKFKLELPSPVRTGPLLDLGVRLPEIETLGVGDGETVLRTEGSDIFLNINLDVDNLLTAIRILPVPLQA